MNFERHSFYTERQPFFEKGDEFPDEGEYAYTEEGVVIGLSDNPEVVKRRARAHKLAQNNKNGHEHAAMRRRHPGMRKRKRGN